MRKLINEYMWVEAGTEATGFVRIKMYLVDNETEGEVIFGTKSLAKLEEKFKVHLNKRCG
jgi:hypothetical protein